MKKFIRIAVLAPLLCFGSTVFGQQLSNGPLLNYPDTALGGVITAEIAKPLDECDKLCSERSGCAGFDHQIATNQCRLYGGIGSARAQSGTTARTRNQLSNYRDPTNLPRQSAQQQQPVQPQPPPPQPRIFSRFAHYDLNGYDLLQTSSNSIAQCEDLCRGNNLCVAYTFNAWNQKCFLKNNVDQLRLDARAISGSLDGHPRPGFRNAPIVMEYYANYIISGSTIGGVRSAGSRNQCETMCWDNNSCIAFSFSQSRRQCSLFNDADNRFPRSGIDSGSKIQPRPE